MNSLDLVVIVSIVASILCILTTSIILRRRGFQEGIVRLLIVYVVVLGLLELMRAISRLGWFAFFTNDAFSQMALYGVLLLSLLFLHLSRSFLRLKGPGWEWWGLGAVWLVLLTILANEWLPLPEALLTNDRWLIADQGPAFSVLLLGWLILMGGAVFSTVIAYTRVHQPLHRNRITYWFLSLILTVAGAVLHFAGPDASYAPLSTGLYLLGALSATYAVQTHRLFDMRQAARQVIKYLISTLLAVALYTIAFLIANYLFQTVPGYAPWMIGVALALILALLFEPLLHLVQRLVTRLLSGVVRDPSHTLREYSASISNILDLEQLATVSTGLISEAMEIRHGALFVVHREDGEGEGEEKESYFHLRGVRGMGEGDDPIPSALPTDSPLADYLRQEHSPLTQYDIDLHPRFQSITSSARDWFSDLEMDVYVPIYAKGEWIGLLALGPKRSGDRYFDDELVLLSTLADQTAVALENARLFDDLKARSAEVERLNEDLAVANRELIQMGQAKSDFIDIASHELRTPLTQVRGYTDILREMIESDSLSAKGGMKLTKGLKKASERLEEIINTMFDVAQIDTQTLELSLFPDSLDSIVKAAVKPWTEALEKRKLTFAAEGLDSLPSISADGKRLQQAFSHIIQNAIKYTPDGGQIRVTASMLEWTLPQDQSIEIVVADTGIGIAPEELERIFEKFYRVGDVLLHSTGKTKFKGAGPGLGLTIARGIVEAHGGRIWAESPGYNEETCPGGEFHIVLPVQPPRSSKVGDRVVFLTG
ncbi:MAG: GAF domain-containing sensor histidine kinase [Chloroflexi bacterium]|nr:GAF domain-containing sensor histidine kinase [Chloroflexota bacterium]